MKTLIEQQSGQPAWCQFLLVMAITLLVMIPATTLAQSDRDRNWRHYQNGTYVRDTWTLVDQLAIASFIVIGTSLGGLLAMIMASQRPERLKAIVLNDIGPEVDPAGYARILSSAGWQGEVDNWREAEQQCREAYGPALPDMRLFSTSPRP